VGFKLSQLSTPSRLKVSFFVPGHTFVEMKPLEFRYGWKQKMKGRKDEFV
jgi:hypothetical protein